MDDRGPKAPDYEIAIDKLDESKVKAYWHDLLLNDPNWNVVWKPDDVVRYAAAIQAGAA